MVRTSWTSPVCLVHLVSLVGLVYLVSLVHLVYRSIWFVLLLDPEKPNKLNKPNKRDRPNEQDGLAGFFSILLKMIRGGTPRIVVIGYAEESEMTCPP